MGKLREGNDPQLTYEGDNYVLMQQLIGYALKNYKRNGVLKIIDFELNEKIEMFPKSIGSFENFSDLEKAMRGLVFVLLKLGSLHNELSKLDLAKSVVNVFTGWQQNWV